jgi:hypothetical protein
MVVLSDGDRSEQVAPRHMNRGGPRAGRDLMEETSVWLSARLEDFLGERC